MIFLINLLLYYYQSTEKRSFNQTRECCRERSIWVRFFFSPPGREGRSIQAKITVPRIHELIFPFFVFLASLAWRILVPWSEVKPCPLHWKHGVLTTGLPGKSWPFLYKVCSWIFNNCSLQIEHVFEGGTDPGISIN